MLRAIIRCSSGLLCALAIGAAQAQTAGGSSGAVLEEIIVTAQRVEENVQKTPMNVSVVTGDTISEQGLQNMQDILNGLPGVTVQGQVRGFVPSVRGLGTDLPPGSAQGSVATTVDGVYDIRAEAGRTGYYDLQRVEVLAGPQGTLYGVNADGGVVNILSNDPSLGGFQAGGGLTVGNYNLLNGQGMVNVPLGDSSALRVAVTSTNRDGYLNTGADDNVAAGGRAKYLWQKSEDFSLLLGIEFAKLGGIGSGSVPTYAAGNASPVVVNGVTYSSPWTDATTGTSVSDSNAWDRYHSTKYWGKLNWNLGFGTLSFTPAYKEAHDQTYTCGMGATCTLGADPETLEQNSEELRLSSPSGSGNKWNVGLYHFGYFQHTLGGPGGPNGLTVFQTSNGVFAELTHPFSEVFRGIAGVRETQDRKRDSSGNGPTTWRHFDYRLGLEYDAAPQSMEYVTLATGYRPGGFNSPGPNIPATYETEQVTDLEVGTKNRFFDDRVQLNADVYYYKFKNYQLLDFYFTTCGFGPFPPTYNLDAKNFGVDLNLQAAATEHDIFSMSVAYADAKFTSDQTIGYNYPDSCGPPNFDTPHYGTYTINNSPQPRSPKYSGTASYEHRFALAGGATLSAQPSVHFSASQYVHPVEYIYSFQPSYTTEDFTLLYKPSDDKWSLSLWGRNLGNEAIKAALNPMILNAPRTYGLTFTAHVD